jgi:hypothetical protein
MRLITIALLTLALGATAAHAASAAPGLVNYQGTLTDAFGDPLTGTHDLKFEIFDAVSGGSQIGPDQDFPSVSFDASGRFNVILSNLEDAFDGSTRYLQITVDGGTPLAPRQQFLSTPFAIRADSARTSDQTDFAALAAVALAATPESITAAMREPGRWASIGFSAFTTNIGQNNTWVEVPGSRLSFDNSAGRPLLILLQSTALGDAFLNTLEGGLPSGAASQARLMRTINGGAPTVVRITRNLGGTHNVATSFLDPSAGNLQYYVEIRVNSNDMFDQVQLESTNMQILEL